MIHTSLVPYHVEQIAKVYPVIDSGGNVATGLIYTFDITGQDIKIGSRVVGIMEKDHEEWDATWVYLGGTFFKMIGLWPSQYDC